MRTYEGFINNKTKEIILSEEQLNEGLFDFFKKMFGKIKQQINANKGGKEVQKIFDKYKTIIQNEFKRQANVDLNLSAGEGETKPTVESNYSNLLKYSNFITEDNGVPKPGVITDTTQEMQDKNYNNSGDTIANDKMTVETLKKKTAVLDKIVSLYVDKAMKEMDEVLVKLGGAEKNPKLKIIIGNLKDQFQLDYLESKIKYLETAGDKTIINKMKIDRDKLSKDLTNRWKTIDAAGDVDKGGQLVIGMYYRYNTSEGVKTIKITKQSPNKGKIMAMYVVKDDSTNVNKEQEFTIDNVDTEFKPTPKHKYHYFSETAKSIIEVEVESYEGTPPVLTLKSDKGVFKGHIGALRDEINVPIVPVVGTTYLYVNDDKTETKVKVKSYDVNTKVLVLTTEDNKKFTGNKVESLKPIV